MSDSDLPRQPDASGTPSFVGGSFGVTSRELESDAEQDPEAAFAAVEDAEDTGPDILAGADSVPETVQDDVSRAQDQAEPSDVEGTGTEPAPGSRNEPV
ncbi:hypothetical protein [Ornithinimicrobium pekingense]|uniref:Sugar ABC transporter ATPase n=1 Tax=Ornithinimicrobium pekingense TaxID=384677 RepID=A0ABQ2F9N5_9MICO|nr:hypothetical protein [Ornithinimicrobium pekingense]GGK67405.1 hypothetical protein GCM10011509_14690 [Ornithinimicrobium pekingense]